MIPYQTYFTPGRTPDQALRVACADIDRLGGDTLILPPYPVEVTAALDIPPNVCLFVPFGGQILGTAEVTCRSRVVRSESAAPFSGTVYSAA